MIELKNEQEMNKHEIGKIDLTKNSIHKIFFLFIYSSLSASEGHLSDENSDDDHDDDDDNDDDDDRPTNATPKRRVR
jgi:hypothetical protein